MIEVPRAASRSAHIARYADFFSFGTNDLTQMTFAFSRDDSPSFLPTYINKNVLDVDPFISIDEDGVGFLVAYATEQGRSVNPDLKVGICGEHGGDPATIDFCYRAGLSYVSCSPFRVPLARLAGAQAVLRNSGNGKAVVKKASAPAAKAEEPKAEKTVKPDKAAKTAKPAKAAAKPAKAAAKPAKAAAKPAKPAAKPAKPAKAAGKAEKAPAKKAKPAKK
jgi:pyruvate,orthophosphate dikinase